MLILGSCATAAPERWRTLQYPRQGFVQVEKDSNEHGLYIEYSGVSRAQLLSQIEAALLADGYAKVGVAFDGTVLGYSKGNEKLAVKVDQFGQQLFLAIFDEHGKEPMLHGVVFGTAKAGEPVTGDKAREMLRNEFGH
jgi:hypothetical protein